ncbi:MAG: hypothetical protein U0559_01565 [Anaerolineae bacterium]
MIAAFADLAQVQQRNQRMRVGFLRFERVEPQQNYMLILLDVQVFQRAAIGRAVKVGTPASGSLVPPVPDRACRFFVDVCQHHNAGAWGYVIVQFTGDGGRAPIPAED